MKNDLNLRTPLDVSDDHNITVNDKTFISIEHVARVLNEMLELDEAAIHNLFAARTRISNNSPLIQYENTFVDKENTIGILGVINGLFVGGKRLVATWTIDGEVFHSSRLLKFSAEYRE
jgi:hypothetical protein